MKFTIRIRKDGTLVTEVKDRGSVECSTIKQVTNALGREVSDVQTGPDCDKVEEIVGDRPDF